MTYRRRSSSPIKKILFVLLLLSLAACAGKRYLGKDDASNGSQSPKQPRAADDFTSVVADGFATVHIVVGKDDHHSVAVSCDDGDTSRIETHVNDDHALVIKSETKRLEGMIGNGPKCTVDVEIPTLEAVEQKGSGEITVRGRAVGLSRIGVHGSGDADVDAAQASRVDLKVTGSGSLKLRSLESQKTFVELSGSGGIQVAGKTSAVDVKTHGSGEVDTRSLTAESCHLESRGSSSAKLFASRRSEVDITGSGDAIIAGRPSEKSANVRGSGTVRYE
jgi:hypothetical protein